MSNAYNIDVDTWGSENEWFDWSAENPPSQYSFSRYSDVFYQHFKSCEMLSPYYYKSTFNNDEAQETFRVQWRGVWVYDFYHDPNQPEPKFKANKLVEVKQFPTPWGFGLKSPMSNTFVVLPAYDVGAYEQGNQFPEAQISYFWTSLAENYGPQPNVFKPGDDWGTETDTSKARKPMPFVPCFGGTPSDTLSFSRRNQPARTFNNTYVGTPNYIPLSFNYQKIIVVPCIYCAKEDDSQFGLRFGGKKTLQQYFEGINWDAEHQTGTPPANIEFPIITAVCIDRIYFGAENETRSGRRYVDGANLNSLLPDYLTTGKVPSTLIKINNTYTLKGSKWGESDNADHWLPAYGYAIANGVISGMGICKTSVSIQGMTINTSINDLRKAYIMATQSDTAVLNLFHQNGDYELYTKQSHTNNGYGYQIGNAAVWREPTKEKVLRDVAYLGFWFSDDYDTAATGLTGENCNSSKMHIPLFDKDGLTTGEYKSGTDAALEDNAKWGDPFKSNPYNPDKQYGNNDENDFGDLENRAQWGRINNNLNVYLLRDYQFDKFVTDVNTAYRSNPDGVTQWELDFNGANPSDYIVSTFVTPLILPKTDTNFNIKLGALTFEDINVPKYAYSAVDEFDNIAGTFDCGDVTVNAYYGDFRDYAPYTNIELYLPLAGTVKIEPEFFIGHTLNVKCFYDVYTMSLCYGIYRDRTTLYKTVNGVGGAEIPLTSMRMGDYQNNVHNIEQALKQNEMRGAFGILSMGASAAAAVATGNAGIGTAVGLIGGGGVFTSLNDRQDLYYKLEHTQPTPSGTTAAEAQNGFCVGGYYPILFIKRAKMQSGYDADIYSHTVGNACLMQSKIKDMSGLIKCSNADLSGIPATAEEINAIQTALQNGVYV